MAFKKITIDRISEEDFRSVAGALFKTGADFRVETLPDEPTTAVATRRMKDETGRSLGEVIVDTLKARGKTQMSILVQTLVNQEWARSSVHNKLKQLTGEGKIKRQGDWYYPVEVTNAGPSTQGA